MPARLAKSLETLRAQVNIRWPKRSKISDGWIGDTAHSNRKSDHNPNSKGVVTALDLTHDPRIGMDAGKLAEELRLSNDHRIKYIISNGRIANTGQPWRKYTGSNAHTKHVHVSVGNDYDNTKPWSVGGAVIAPETEVPVVIPQTPVLKKGSKGEAVKRLQNELTEHNYTVKADGDFGPKTEAKVKEFQGANALKADGTVGPKTWEALLREEPDNDIAITAVPWPLKAKSFLMDKGMSNVAASAFVASLIWESGGNQKEPWTIKWDAIGDNGNSIGAGQWNKAAGRAKGLTDLAERRGVHWSDPTTQLEHAWYELKTSEKRAYNALMKAQTIEEANKAAISYWRPGVPHADRRLAIAKKVEGMENVS